MTTLLTPPPSHSPSLTDEARELIAATADVAGDKVAQARQRLSDALHYAEQTGSNLRASAVAQAKTADRTVRQHPYTAMGVALGLGAVLGCLLTWRTRE